MGKQDVIKQPSHYVEGRKYEPKDVIRDWGLNFNLGNAVKYLARAGRKDDIVQDLKKAQEYIQFEIEAIEAERKREASVEMENGGKDDVILIKAPIGMAPEEVIKFVISKVYGGI